MLEDPDLLCLMACQVVFCECVKAGPAADELDLARINFTSLVTEFSSL